MTEDRDGAIPRGYRDLLDSTALMNVATIGARGRPKLPAYLASASGNDLSALSLRSQLSFASVRSVLSIFSAGSILSILSAGSILSIGSAGSILSIGSAGSILGIGRAGYVRDEEDPADEPDGS